MLETIIKSMARTLFVCAYADAADRNELPPDSPTAGCGQDWMDVAPSTPDDYTGAAWRLCGKIEQLNGMSLICLFAQACKADGEDCEAMANRARVDESTHTDNAYIEGFGHYLVMQSLGHGVSWFDDHNEFQLRLPHIETELLA